MDTNKAMANVIPKFCIKQALTPELLKYEEAVRALNSLQTNASVIRESVARNISVGTVKPQMHNVELTTKYMSRVGINVEDIEKRVIHITGTKGKGSTALLTEAVLRSAPYKTGLFMSPHVICLRERISINGSPLSPQKFVDYFWPIFNTLHQFKEHERDMPTYFKFLTVMAMKVFIAEEVDVAIIEVGIGGELDCTNVFKKTPVVGISSIGLDHTRILGDTKEKIAWEKAGLMKEACKAFITSNIEPSVLGVIQQRAKEKKCTLELVPNITEYKGWNRSQLIPPKILNASLALHLAKAWSDFNNNQEHVPSSGRLEVTEKDAKAIDSCIIKGRCQKVQVSERLSYFLDGAHTSESIVVAKEWFLSTSPENSFRILVFNITNNRSSQKFLEVLMECNFSEAYFCTNYISQDQSDLPADLVSKTTTGEGALSEAIENQRIWISLCKNQIKSEFVFSVSEALSLVENRTNMNDGNISVLVTGSLHLVGSVLTILENT